MIVNGQPKSTADISRLAARIGRGIDGLVITLYNFGRPRDLSHFEHFITYHSALLPQRGGDKRHAVGTSRTGQGPARHQLLRRSAI